MYTCGASRDSISFLPFALNTLYDAFALTAPKSWYPHYLNTGANVYYVGKIPNVSYYGGNKMSASVKRELLAWY